MQQAFFCILTVSKVKHACVYVFAFLPLEHVTSPKSWMSLFFLPSYVLEGAACYAGLLLAPAEGFGRGLFLPFGQKKVFYVCFGPNFGNFW